MSERGLILSSACGAIAVACWATASGLPLWALILVAALAEELRR